jgi:hypothetical protein
MSIVCKNRQLNAVGTPQPERLELRNPPSKVLMVKVTVPRSKIKDI